MEVRDDEDQRKSAILKVTENKNVDCKKDSNHSHSKIESEEDVQSRFATTKLSKKTYFKILGFLFNRH